MIDFHILIIDGEENYQEKVAKVINELVPGQVHIHKTRSLKYAQELIDRKVKIVGIIIDINLKDGQDVSEFISWLSRSKKGKTIVYSKNDQIRHKCSMHLHMATVRKERSAETLRSVLTLLLMRTFDI